MGKNRCAQICDTNGLQLAGVCDINGQKAKEVGEQFGVPYSTDINTFLQDPTVEAMYVVVPTGSHAEVAKQCINAGKHVLVTKPMEINFERCDELIALAKEKNVILGCDFDLHFRGAVKGVEKGGAGRFFW